MRAPLVVSLWVGLTVSVVFIGVIDGPFHFDDEHSITGNPNIRQPIDWGRIVTDPSVFSRNPGSGMYRPVVLTSYVANYAAGGLDPRGWHLFNLLLHVGCTILVGLLAWRLTADRTAHWTAALIFGLHPLATETVNYISSRSESLALMFCLASILVYLAAAGRGRLLGLSLALFALGLGCKVTAMLALPVLLLHEWSRGRLAQSWRRWLPFALVGAGYVIGVKHLWQEALFETPVREPSIQLLTQAKALSYYLKIALVPVGLTIEHAFSLAASWADGAVIASLGLLASVLWLISRHFRDRPLVVLMAWPLLGLLPTIVVPLNVLVSEHRLYPALAGVAILVAVGARTWLQGRPHRVAMIGLVVMSVLCVGRNQVWASERLIWEEAARYGSVRAHVRLGIQKRQQGDLTGAEVHLRTALARSPDHAPALNNLGNVLRQRGQQAEAEDLYKAALVILPSYPEALINLGSLRALAGDTQRALHLYRQATHIAPDHFEGWNNLGTLHLQRGEPALAQSALEEGLKRRPDSARILYNLSGALDMQGQTAQAIEMLRRAVGYQQDYAPAWLNLGNLLRKQGQLSGARSAYEHFLVVWDGDPAIAVRVKAQLSGLVDEAQ
mgnify:FL=1